MRRPVGDDTIAIPLRAVRRTLLLMALAAVVVAVAALLYQQRSRIFPGEARFVNADGYQAVFLIGGQVYFGRVTIDGDDYLLRDVFYLNAPADSGGRGQLVRRGAEVHGPTEPMVIPQPSVLFFENLRDDSEVVAAIRLIKSGQVPAATPAPAPAATPASTARPSASPTR